MIETKTVNITPEIAKKYLEHNNDRNRKVSRVRVAEYARMMKDGKWMLTHQGIAFDNGGILMDGQHRLRAVIESGCTVKMLVTTGIECDEHGLIHVDEGMARSVKQQLHMRGDTDRLYEYFTPTVNVFMLQYGMKKQHDMVGADRVIDYINNHKDTFETLWLIMGGGSPTTHGRRAASKSGAMVRMTEIGKCALLMALYRGEDPNKLEAFVACYNKNDITKAMENGCNPKMALDAKEKFQTFPNNKNGRAEAYDMLLRAIYGFCRNVKIVYGKGREKYKFNALLDA